MEKGRVWLGFTYEILIIINVEVYKVLKNIAKLKFMINVSCMELVL